MITTLATRGLGPLLDVPVPLGPFVDAGVLGPADVHVAATLARVGGEKSAEVLLAAALAVRAPRRRHVCVDLATVGSRTIAELVDPTSERVAGDVGELFDDPVARAEALAASLPWPPLDQWRAVLRESRLVAVRDPADLNEPQDAAADVAPLTLAGDRLYLDRYWRYERRVAAALTVRAATAAPVDPEVVAAILERLFDGEPVDRQRVAAATAACRYLTVVAGGPGTGKTTTVARLLRTLASVARTAGAPVPHVGLAAPTGKAAARLTESLREAVAELEDDDPDRAWLAGLAATTVHRLLGARGRSTRFRYDRHAPLPHDLVVIDETSMVPLALLAKLLEAVRSDAHLILVGDPHQLASVEAGSVLGDVVGDTRLAPRRHPEVRAELAAVAGEAHLADVVASDRRSVNDAVVVLDRVHRFRPESGVDRFATAVRDGRTDDALHVLGTADDLTWVSTDPKDPGSRSDTALAAVRGAVLAPYARVLAAAREGDAEGALGCLDEVRVLCAHRRGRDGVVGWNPRIETWAVEDVDLDPVARWYVGRPVLVTSNDRRLELWNGDLGVVVRDVEGGGVTVAFPGLAAGPPRRIVPSRLGAAETVHAMTVHKSQGSQVDHAVVVLPDPASRICTRELLYTAVTRARRHVTVIASPATLQATVAARTQRASGLGATLQTGGD